MARKQIIAVLIRIIDLCDEDYRELLLYSWNSPIPELNGNHLCHIATEAINSFSRPEQQDIQHFTPGIRYWREMTSATILIIDTIIQLNGLIPVVYSRSRAKTIVSGHLGRKLTVLKILVILIVEMEH